jgi:hypothetical protein
LTIIEPDFIVRLLHNTGFIVKVVDAVPTLLSVGELAVVPSAVLTGSILSSDCDGSERYNCLVATSELVVTVCVALVGPLQPAAVAVIIVVLLHAATKVTWPVDELTVLPAAKLAASNE